MIASNNVTKVVLPAWVYEGEKTEQEIHRNASQYLQRVPKRYLGYRILKIENGMAVCERMEIQCET
ncbi:hypothetical protein [Bacillus mycoides]|uniref:hypothetical protein n=1 Tax=Bacillus mycoides TaxID=1405 RepID=UPI002111AAA2|nr:hypothetical protein [Bacillus mycoides]MCQ6530531.1 hypothetical protein [Bacillus mycoides]